jgi:DNA-binding GntR family transcriptional regulator
VTYTLSNEAGGLSRGDGLAERAYLLLRDAILSHQIPSGSRLSVPEVARQLSISRSPAREAITRIQYEGLADFVPNRGAVVSRIGLDELVEIYDIREVLEGLAARLAARAADPGLTTELERVWTAHREAIQDGDVATHMELDVEFHQLIRTAAGNLRLGEALDRLQGQIRLAMGTTSQRGGGMQAALAEHRQLIEAISAGDPIAAERVARDHIRRLRDSLAEAQDQQDSPHTNDNAPRHRQETQSR